MEKLDRVLSLLADELKGMKGKAEVCVSDNASEDGTQEVLRKWAGRLPLESSRNDENLGYDVNLLKSLQLAGAHFAWFLSDDDELVPGAVKRIVLDLEKNRGTGFGAAFFNIEDRNGIPMIKLGFKDFSVFGLKRSGLGLDINSISTVIVDREKAMQVIKEDVRIDGCSLYKKKLGGYVFDIYFQTYLFLECAAKAGRFAVAPYCGIRTRGESRQITYENKMHRDLIGLKYRYDFKKYYGWFNPGPPRYNIGSYFIWSLIVNERPDLRRAFEAACRLFAYLLKRDGYWWQAALVSMLYKLERIGPLAPPFGAMERLVFKRLLGKTKLIKNVQDQDSAQKKNLELLVSVVEKLDDAR